MSLNIFGEEKFIPEITDFDVSGNTVRYVERPSGDGELYFPDNSPMKQNLNLPFAESKRARFRNEVERISEEGFEGDGDALYEHLDEVMRDIEDPGWRDRDYSEKPTKEDLFPH